MFPDLTYPQPQIPNQHHLKGHRYSSRVHWGRGRYSQGGWLWAGIRTVLGCLTIGYAKNPSLKQQLFSYAVPGFAFLEAMGLFCLAMAFLILFAI